LGRRKEQFAVYKSLRIRNFKCFEDLDVHSLKRINLISGPNNVGKTALLEAFFIHAGAPNPNLTLVVNALRGLETSRIDLSRLKETPWDSVFRNFDTEQTVEMEGEDEATGHRRVRMRVIREEAELKKVSQSLPQFKVDFRPAVSAKVEPAKVEPAPVSGSPATGSLSSGTARVLELEYENSTGSGKVYGILDAAGLRTEPLIVSPQFPSFLLAARGRVSPQEEAERFANLQVERKDKVVLDALQLLEPRLQAISMVFSASTPMLSADVGLKHLIPLPLIGGGMTRLASLAIHLGNSSDGLLLVDEIENGIYHSSLGKMWGALGEAAKDFKTQLIATTHSLECITAAHDTFSKSKHYDFALHRLERSKEGAVRVVTYDRDTLAAAIRTELEVR
jgi:predicted ATPase